VSGKKQSLFVGKDAQRHTVSPGEIASFSSFDLSSIGALDKAESCINKKNKWDHRPMDSTLFSSFRKKRSDYEKLVEGGIIMTIQQRSCSGYKMAIQLFVATVMLTLVVVPTAGATSDKETPERHESTIGSGAHYTTTVYRQTKGDLSAEDFRQVSTLASQIVQHLNAAVAYLDVYDQKKAETELNQSEKLIGVIRDMLPLTVVTTITKNAQGKEVYRDENQMQDDLVPVYELMTSVDVVAPIIDAKKEEAALKGLRLSDAKILHTSVLLDLSFVDRKIKRAFKLLAKEPEEAQKELTLAQTVGVRLSVDKEDSPLVKAQGALRLAERMVNEGKTEGAEENLRLAKIHLEAYRTLVGQSRKEEIDKMQEDIDRLFGKLEKEESESTIRELWNRATGWLTRKSGQTHQVATQDEE
jgi:hypothetical protein